MCAIKTVFGLILVGALAGANAAPVSFNGTNTGDIPDNAPSGRTVSFSVGGLSNPITTVELSSNLTHPYAGDLTAADCARRDSSAGGDRANGPHPHGHLRRQLKLWRYLRV